MHQVHATEELILIHRTLSAELSGHREAEGQIGALEQEMAKAFDVVKIWQKSFHPDDGSVWLPFQ